MQFKDIRQNYPIYILDKDNGHFITGKVTATTFPHYENPQQTLPGGLPNYNTQSNLNRKVVDLTIEADGKTATYVVSESASTNYAGSLVIATEKSLLIPEMEAIANSAENFLATVDQRKVDAEEMLKKAKAMLAEISPQFKQQQEYDARFNRLEKSNEELKDLISNFIKEFKS